MIFNRKRSFGTVDFDSRFKLNIVLETRYKTTLNILCGFKVLLRSNFLHNPCSFSHLPCTSMACSCLILVHGSLRTTSHIYSPVSVLRTLATCKDPFIHNLILSEIASFAADSLYAISSVSLYHRILSGTPPVSSVPAYANTS